MVCDSFPAEKNKGLPIREQTIVWFDMEGHDILADTEEVLYDFDVLPAAGASSLSDEYGLLGPD